MPKHTLNFGRWLERLGFTDGLQPDVIRAVQPVQVVSDASSLVSPLLPPLAVAGGRQTPGGGNIVALEVLSLAPGGTFVRDLNVAAASGSNNNRVAFVTPTAIASINPTVKAKFEMGPSPTVSRIRIVEIVAVNIPAINDIPSLFGLGNSGSRWVDGFYIPTASLLYAYANLSAQTSFSVTIEDSLAQPG